MKPFLKWVGGKTQLLPELRARIPPRWNPETDLYVEPFLGGGALFFDLEPKQSILADINTSLIVTYLAICRRLPEVWMELVEWRDRYRRSPQETYFEARQAYNAEEEKRGIRLAALFLFLNKACFNGLYRVNRKGEFNVPWCKNPDVGFQTFDHLAMCSAALKGSKLLTSDFDKLLVDTDLHGVLIYCDPPYAPVSKTSNFTGYASGGFGSYDQDRLIVTASMWRDAGAHVILSQAADGGLIDKYRQCGFTCDRVQARRAVNSKGSKRGPVDECIIYGG
jgi:DNA adenine methylase